MEAVYKKAVTLLAARDYSTEQLRARLTRHFDDGEARAIADALDALTGQGALDDRRFAANFVRRRPETSVQGLRAELRRRGVDAAVVEEVLSGPGHERLSLSAVLDATMDRFRLRPPLAPRGAARLFRALKRLGYGDEEIQEELERLL
jgi:SOS response regulatory protein OraA/RecX